MTGAEMGDTLGKGPCLVAKWQHTASIVLMRHLKLLNLSIAEQFNG